MRTEFLPMTTNHSWNSSDAQGIIQAGWYRQRLGSTQCVSHKPHSVCRLCWIFLYFYLVFSLFFFSFIYFLFICSSSFFIYISCFYLIYLLVYFLFIYFLSSLILIYFYLLIAFLFVLLLFGYWLVLFLIYSIFIYLSICLFSSKPATVAGTFAFKWKHWPIHIHCTSSSVVLSSDCHRTKTGSRSPGGGSRTLCVIFRSVTPWTLVMMLVRDNFFVKNPQKTHFVLKARSMMFFYYSSNHHNNLRVTSALLGWM